MSFFSKFFKCCESSQVIQGEAKSELQIIQTDQQQLKDDPNLPNTPKIPEKPVNNKNFRAANKEISFINLEVINGYSSPRKRNPNQSSDNNKGNSLSPHKELSFINLEVTSNVNSPKKKKKEENFEDEDIISLANENIKNQSPKGKKKKEKIKMELKYATLGEFEINNLDKQAKPKEEGDSPKFSEIKTLKSLLNEEDCDIALLKKPFKKFQTVQDDNKSKDKRNSQVEEIINLKKQLKELKENNIDADTTPIFDKNKIAKF